MSKVAKKPKVSVVIPTYNCEAFLQRCLDSVYAQTFTDFELIAINDGSTDGSLEILRANEKQHKNMRVIDQENSGQGFARNMAVELAKGEYILFVDSDDFIEPLTLELSVTRAEEDASDLVHFDWKFSSLLPHRPAAYLYLNKEPFAHKDMLVGNECDELLQLWHFYTVNNLFRKSFLKKHKIRYGEGRIYEDIIFMTLVANRAEKVSLLHSPLYIVQRNMSSSSRSGYHDDRHSKGYIRAIRNSLEVLKPRTEYTTYYLVKYFQTKFIFYYTKRIPRSVRKEFLREYVDVMSGVDVVIPPNTPEKIMRLCLQHDIYRKKQYSLFRALVFYKTTVLPKRDKTIDIARQLKHRVVVGSTIYEREFKKPTTKKSILFLGFDYRYTGNSKYLFEDIIKDTRFKNRDIRFVTDDESVDEKYRIAAKSDEYYKWIARAETIITESWMPGNIKKRDDVIFLQLWHGTPLKKVLFDSSESEIMRVKHEYKISKHRNLMNWDYLLADSDMAVNKFNSSFLLPKNRIIQAGYPRVKYLIENKDNEVLKRRIKESIGFDEKLRNKKVVLYAPTWRDYNYGKPAEKQNLDYMMDVNDLASRLGDSYLVLYRDHHFLSEMPSTMHKNCVNVSGYEAQDLLLIADNLVTDFSSILFDALPINLPITLFVNDYERYQKSRGVYADIWKDFKTYVVASEGAVAARVKSQTGEMQYGDLNRKYGYESRVSLVDFIASLDVKTLERDW